MSINQLLINTIVKNTTHGLTVEEEDLCFRALLRTLTTAEKIRVVRELQESH